MSDWIYNSDSSPLFVCVRLLKYQGLVCFLISVSLYYPPQDLCVFYCLNFKRKPSAQMLKLVDMVTWWHGDMVTVWLTWLPPSARGRHAGHVGAAGEVLPRQAGGAEDAAMWGLVFTGISIRLCWENKSIDISFYWLKYIFNDVFVHTFLSDWSFVYLMREFNNRCLHYRKCWVRAS